MISKATKPYKPPTAATNLFSNHSHLIPSLLLRLHLRQKNNRNLALRARNTFLKDNNLKQLNSPNPKSKYQNFPSTIITKMKTLFNPYLKGNLYYRKNKLIRVNHHSQAKRLNYTNSSTQPYKSTKTEKMIYNLL